MSEKQIKELKERIETDFNTIKELQKDNDYLGELNNGLNYACDEYKAVIDKINTHVRILQDGDPENELPEEILNDIDKITGRKL